MRLCCTDTVRESALKVDAGRKIPCRTGESNLRRRRAGLMLNQMGYIRRPLENRLRFVFRLKFVFSPYIILCDLTWLSTILLTEAWHRLTFVT